MDLSRRELGMTSMRTYAVFVLLLALCACKVGPNYKRPTLSVPGDYRGVAPSATTQHATDRRTIRRNEVAGRLPG